ncbi:hypothetical protein A7982_12244 [Minicystis rosea]|nr:hypothetical protein A7982_12244 [Minicystis rosea]
MSLDCPRCAEVVLDEHRVAPAGGGAAVALSLCASCRGVWLDGHTLTALCPTLSHLPEHRDEIALLGREGEGIARCLRCHIAPFEYDVLGVAIDFCLRCYGVWLDGDEYEESLLEGATDTAAEARGGPYRRTARSLPGREPRCAYCHDSVEPRRTFMRELGIACARCHYQLEEEAADRRRADRPPLALHDSDRLRKRTVIEEMARAVLDLLGR